MYNRTASGYCQVVCHAGPRFNDRWEQLEEWFVKNGIGPLESHETLGTRAIVKHSHTTDRTPTNGLTADARV